MEIHTYFAPLKVYFRIQIFMCLMQICCVGLKKQQVSGTAGGSKTLGEHPIEHGRGDGFPG
jgi:hypothetical protein